MLKPGMVSSLSSVPPVWPRLTAGDHGDADAGGSAGWVGEAGGGEDGGDEEGGLVAYAAGGVLVDGEGVEGRGVEDLAGEAHGGGEVGELLRGEAAEEDGHEKRGDLGVGDGAVDYAVDEVLDLGGGEGEAVALVADDVGGVDVLGHLVTDGAWRSVKEDTPGSGGYLGWTAVRLLLGYPLPHVFCANSSKDMR